MRVNSRAWAWARVALLVSALAPSACSEAAGGPAESVRASIRDGQSDSADANVFLLVANLGRGEGALCSASLLAPNLLLTARHCVSTIPDERAACDVSRAGTPLPVNALFAANSLTVAGRTEQYPVRSLSVPSEPLLCGSDLALVTLARSVPANVATPLVPRIESPVSQAERYRAVGYGLDTPGDGGVAGQRRSRTDLSVRCVPGKCGSAAEPTEFIGTIGTCEGDSGGPALDADGQVVGVASRSDPDCRAPIYGSVASWKAWLVAGAQAAAALGGYPVPAWAAPETEDPLPDASAAGASGAGASAAGSTPLGVQGAPCSGPAECAADYACFSPTLEVEDAYCAARCTERADCPSGSACRADLGVCVASAGSARPAASSCALRGFAGEALGPSALALGLVAVIWARRQRRR